MRAFGGRERTGAAYGDLWPARVSRDTAIVPTVGPHSIIEAIPN
jgi:hypothetical protein